MKTKICKSLLSQAVGLMFSGRKRAILVFPKERRIRLHTLFVFFPIKVEFLNQRKRVVERAVIKPFSFYSSKKKAKYVVETPVPRRS